MLRNLLDFFFLLFGLMLLLSVVCPVKDYVKNMDAVAQQTDQQEVEMVYYKVFFLSNSWKQPDISGCIVRFKANGLQRNKNNSILICQERINLLREKQVVALWQKQNRLHGFVLLDMPEIGISHVKAHLISVKNVSKIKGNNYSYLINHINAANSMRPVTGIFTRHVTNVRRYLFKNIKTGRISAVNATPGHRFYVSNQQAFISISKVSPLDKLITDNGEEVRIVIGIQGGEQKENHDKFHYSETVKTVYNLEISQKHTYFVGLLHICVHNIYTILRDDNSVAFKGSINEDTFTGLFYRGDGTLEYSGSIRGDFKAAQYYGFGRKFNEREELVYEGNWLDGKRDGYGESFVYGISPDGDRIEQFKEYSGDWKDGYRHGRGTAYYKKKINGVECVHLEGVFEKNHLLNGKYYDFLYFDQQGVVNPVLLYMGEFKDLKYHGSGIFYNYLNKGRQCQGYIEGEWYENEFINGVGYAIKGNIRRLYSNGKAYYGDTW